MVIFTACPQRSGHLQDPKGSLDVESLKKPSIPDFPCQTPGLRGNLSPPIKKGEKWGSLPFGPSPFLPCPRSPSPRALSAPGKKCRPVPRGAASPPRTPGPARPRGRAPALGRHLSLHHVRRLPDRPRIKRPQPPPTPGMRATGRAPQAQGAAGILRNLQFSYCVRVTAR